MCLSPITIYNRSVFINGSAPLFYKVPCGKCAECIRAKENEYTLRAYYEHKNSVYSYFDTLTFDDKHLNYYEGIPCFSKKVVKGFFKRMRAYLKRRGFDKDAFSYFLSSELGGCHKRPHHHVLFFVHDKNLDVMTLKKAINNSWHQGITDSVLRTKKRIVNSVCALNYVAKYVTKDLDSQHELKFKLDLKLNNIKNKKERQETKNEIYPFHLQSQGFGLSMLYEERLLNLAVNEGAAELPVHKKMPIKIALPMYFQRKLFYDLGELTDGRSIWILNDLGRAYRDSKVQTSIRILKERYERIFNNLPQYTDNPLLFKYKIEKKLGNRSFEDFAKYVLYYRGHLRFKNEGGLIEELIPLDEWLLKRYDEGVNSILDTKDMNEYHEGIDLLQQCMITQDTYKEFKGFDDLYEIFDSLSYTFNKGIQRYQDQLTEIKNRLKLLKKLTN